jgi:hypothetical protein
MMEQKRKALEDLKAMLGDEKAKKMKVMVAGNNPMAVKEGLEKAEDVVEKMPGVESKMPEMMGKDSGESSSKVDEIMASLSEEEKMELMKKLMSSKGEEESDDMEESC